METTLTQERLKQLLNYEPETGVFTWLVSRQCVPVGRVAGSLHRTGYRRIRVDLRLYSAHRLAWLYMSGTWPNEIDHRNRVRDDNRFENLRDVSHLQNSQNKLPGRGACRRAHGWESAHKYNGQTKYLGTFGSEEAANAAYLASRAAAEQQAIG